MLGLCVMQGSIVLFFAEGGGKLGLVSIRPWCKISFDYRRRTKCHGEKGPRITAFPFQYKENKEMPQVQAANAWTHSGKMPTTDGRI